MIDVVKKEILKLLEVGVIYPIFDRKWTSPIQVVPKKFRVTIVKNDDNQIVPTRVQSGWRVCIDDTGVSLCALISNYMHLAQIFQVKKDVKITYSPSPQVTCSPSNNKNPQIG